MAMNFWILDGKTPVMASEDEWATMLGHSDRCRIAVTEGEGWYVSTMFLGLDHSAGFGSPALFGTMLFHGDDWQGDYLTHACTWEEAEGRHAEAVRIARGD